MSSDLYREIIIDHYQNPRNYGRLEGADIGWREPNPLCGDVIEMQVKFGPDGKASEVKFDGDGCAISKASASLLTEMILGKNLEELEKLGKKEILDALGIDPGPSRLKCALLPLQSLKLGIMAYKEKRK